MPKRDIIDVRLYVGPGDYEDNEVQVYIYLPLTIPRSRCRIRKGGPEGNQVTAPLGYGINSRDVLEYMTKNEDLVFLILKLMQADVLRDIRRQARKEAKSPEEILNLLQEKKSDFEAREWNFRDEIVSLSKSPIATVLKEIEKYL